MAFSARAQNEPHALYNSCPTLTSFLSFDHAHRISALARRVRQCRIAPASPRTSSVNHLPHLDRTAANRYRIRVECTLSMHFYLCSSQQRDQLRECRPSLVGVTILRPVSPVDSTDLPSGQGCPVTACCTTTFETQYYNCLECVGMALDATSYAIAQNNLNRTSNTSHTIPSLTFPLLPTSALYDLRGHGLRLAPAGVTRPDS